MTIPEFIEVIKEQLELENVEINGDTVFESLGDFDSISIMAIVAMIDEHFGISVVEFMASGLITIAHNSGGPRDDIIDSGKSGFLADTKLEYVELIARTLEMTLEEAKEIRETAQEKARTRFGSELFGSMFVRQLKMLDN